MIITMTLNPGLDLTYRVHDEQLGTADVHRAECATIEASGKGVNVSRTLTFAGVPTLAILPVAGATGLHLEQLLVDEGVPHITVPVPGQTRVNTSVLLNSGRTVKVNAPGPTLAVEDINALVGTLDSVLAQSDDRDHWVAVCGSLPEGTSPAVYSRLVEVTRLHGAHCAIDASGRALEAAARAGADLLTPNHLELGDLARARLGDADVGSVLRTARLVAASTGSAMLVSMGAAGAIYAGDGIALHGHGTPLRAVNTAGAGDAFLAGWLSQDAPPRQRMIAAMRFGRSACLSPYTVDRTPGTNGSQSIEVVDLVEQSGSHL